MRQRPPNTAASTANTHVLPAAAAYQFETVLLCVSIQTTVELVIGLVIDHSSTYACWTEQR